MAALSSTHPKLPTGRRFMLLQVYRGLVAMLVLVYHAGSTQSRDKLGGFGLFDGLFDFGYSGVDFFFVLSGFIIFYTQYKYLWQSDRLKPYFVKRFVRIYPFFWIVNTVIILIFLILPGYGPGRKMNPFSILYSYTLLPNPFHQPILVVGWTLVLEVCFYLLFGLLFIMPKRWAKVLFGTIIGTSLLLYVAQLVGLVVGWRQIIGVPFPLDFLLSRHTLEFAMGALSAYLIMTRRIPKPVFWVVLGAGLYIAFGLTESFWADIFNRHHRIFAYGVPSFILVTGSVAYELRREARVPRVLSFLGDASYSVYLVHSLAISIVYGLYLLVFDIPTNPLWLVLGAIVAATLFGCAAYQWVEKPVLQMGRAWANRILKPSQPNSAETPTA